MRYKPEQNLSTDEYGEDIEFDPKGGSFKDVVMYHFNRCVKFMSVEFRGGYFTIVPTKDGQDKEVYIADTREIYSNAVLAMAMILQPKFDEEMCKSWNEYKEKLQTIKKFFIDNSTPNEDIILGDSFYTTDRDRLLLESYKQKKLEIYIDLFSALSELLGRTNYLSIAGVVM